jgi:hypothetical protein
MDLAGIEMFGFFGIILAIATYDIIKTRLEIIADRKKAAEAEAIESNSQAPTVAIVAAETFGRVQPEAVNDRLLRPAPARGDTA